MTEESPKQSEASSKKVHYPVDAIWLRKWLQGFQEDAEKQLECLQLIRRDVRILAVIALLGFIAGVIALIAALAT